VAAWLAGVRAAAMSITLAVRPLDVLDQGEAALRELGAALLNDAGFAERPLWRGAPAETGPWTRSGHAEAPRDVWERLGARLADLARIASGVPLAQGAIALAPGVGLAWSEMARGLLLHAVELEAGERDADGARAARYRVLAPTEWNFHPDGAFGRRVAEASLDGAGMRLAAAALDPCVALEITAGALRDA
jgi:hypothetical protein